MSTFLHKLSARFLKTLLATPAGRAHLLNGVAHAESSDEGAIFEKLLVHVRDEKLRQMVSKHHDDEKRHGQLLTAQRVRTGVDPGEVPPDLQILPRINALTGGLMDRPIASDLDVMNAYLVLLVIEERAIEQFGQFIPAFDLVDQETADTFRSIHKDEERHLRYCHAISHRYAPSEAVWQESVERFRKLEAKAFAANSFANMSYVFEHGIYEASAVERAAWKALLWLGTVVPQRTQASKAARTTRPEMAAA